MLMTFFL